VEAPWRDPGELKEGVRPVSDARESGEPDTVAADLIEYLIVEVPDLDALSSLVPALAELVETARIRILDLVALSRTADGSVSALEFEAVGSMAALADVDCEVGRMLSEHDIEWASLALRPGSAGVVLVTEDRWARPLSDAAQRAGGQIIGGERIPAHRVESLLTERSADRRTEA
jgi:Family of unknown function (DUF6325)